MILSLKVLFLSVFIQLSNIEFRYTVEDNNIKENLNSLQIEVISFENIDK